MVEQVGDWEMEIIPPDDMDVARTIVAGCCRSLRRPLSVPLGVELMAALTVEFPQTVWTVEFGGDEIVVAPGDDGPGCSWRRWCGRPVNGQTGVVVPTLATSSGSGGTAAGLVDDPCRA